MRCFGQVHPHLWEWLFAKGHLQLRDISQEQRFVLWQRWKPLEVEPELLNDLDELGLHWSLDEGILVCDKSREQDRDVDKRVYNGLCRTMKFNTFSIIRWLGVGQASRRIGNT